MKKQTQTISTMKNNMRLSGFTSLEVLAVFLIAGLLAGLATPQILRARKNAERAEAITNAKQLGLALFCFEEQYGTFPSQEIYKANKEKFKNSNGGDTANDLLGMLLSGEFIDSEEPFYAKGGARTDKKPDNVFNDPKKLLEPGECGFGYVMFKGGKAMSSTSVDSSAPVLITPLEPGSGGADPKFNKKIYNGFIVYLRLDLAVKLVKLDATGKVPAPNNHTLFETGPGTIWEKNAPDVKAPK